MTKEVAHILALKKSSFPSLTSLTDKLPRGESCFKSTLAEEIKIWNFS